MAKIKYSKNFKYHCVRCGKPIKNSIEHYLIRGNYCQNCNRYFDLKTLGRLKYKTKEIKEKLNKYETKNN